MTVVAIHPDPQSLELHLDTGAEKFRRFAELIDLARIDVFGAVGDGVLERLHRESRMLGNATVAVHELHAGFGC